MRGNEFLINYGGEWLDVDAQSVGGFDFTTLWQLDSTRATEKGRTMDLSVPATKNNTRIFNDHKLIPGQGVRRGINGMVVAGGVNITGKIYVTEYSGGRYSLTMAYGHDFAGFGYVNYRSAFLADTITFSSYDVPAANGGVPGFGWYDYGNQQSPHSFVGNPPTLHPVTNLGHVIDRLSAALGYTINYPDVALGRGYQAHAYGLVLPSFGVQSIQGGADVSGSAMGGFSYTFSGVGSLADLGLEVSTMHAFRGVVSPQLVELECFKATRPVHISIPDNSNVVVFGRNTHDLYNDWEGTQGAEFDLLTGDYFSFARPDEWHKVAGEYYWNRYQMPPAFEGNVTVTFSVTRAASYPTNGDTIYLAYALPDHPLEWWLDAYCNIIFAAWTVDESTKTITMKTYGERLGDALADTGKHIALEKEKMIAVENVKRYIDGFAQHNHTRCAGDYDASLSVYPFDRDLRMDNDYLPQERDMEEIPFNDGGIRGGHDDRYYLDIDDVTDDGNGGYNYNGILTVFFENTVSSDGAVHITEILNLGVGLGMSQVIDVPAAASSVPVSYDPDYAIRSDSADLNYALAGIESNDYASIYFVNGSNAETYIYYNFGLSLPVDAAIINVTCAVEYSFGNTGGMTVRQLQLYTGGNAVGTPYDITTGYVKTTAQLDCGNLTAAQLNAAKFRFYAKRGTSATSTSRYIHIYGARIEVEYTYKGERHYAVSNAFSASVRLLLPLFRFAEIDGGACVSFHGRNFVVKNAKWGEGVAQLELVCIPPLIPVRNMMLRTLSVTNVTCFDGADGEIRVEAVGGTAPYTYSLNADFSNSNNTGIFSGLAITGPVQEGTDQYGGILYCYKTVYVRDADGNTAVGAVRLQSPVELDWVLPENIVVYSPTYGDGYAIVDIPVIPHVTTMANIDLTNPLNYIYTPIPADGRFSTNPDSPSSTYNMGYRAKNTCGEISDKSFTITIYPQT